MPACGSPLKIKIRLLCGCTFVRLKEEANDKEIFIYFFNVMSSAFSQSDVIVIFSIPEIWDFGELDKAGTPHRLSALSTNVSAS
jgi:hypothetical protein